MAEEDAHSQARFSGLFQGDEQARQAFAFALTYLGLSSNELLKLEQELRAELANNNPYAYWVAGRLQEIKLNQHAANEYYKKGAQASDPWAMSELAHGLRSVGHTNPTDIIDLCNSAIALGHAGGLWNLAHCYRKGLSPLPAKTSNNEQTAIHLFQQAMAQNYHDAFISCAEIYRASSERRSTNLAAAAKIYRQCYLRFAHYQNNAFSQSIYQYFDNLLKETNLEANFVVRYHYAFTVEDDHEISALITENPIKFLKLLADDELLEAKDKYFLMEQFYVNLLASPKSTTQFFNYLPKPGMFKLLVEMKKKDTHSFTAQISNLDRKSLDLISGYYLYQANKQYPIQFEQVPLKFATRSIEMRQQLHDTIKWLQLIPASSPQRAGACHVSGVHTYQLALLDKYSSLVALQKAQPFFQEAVQLNDHHAQQYYLALLHSINSEMPPQDSEKNILRHYTQEFVHAHLNSFAPFKNQENFVQWQQWLLALDTPEQQAFIIEHLGYALTAKFHETMLQHASTLQALMHGLWRLNAPDLQTAKRCLAAIKIWPNDPQSAIPCLCALLQQEPLAAALFAEHLKTDALFLTHYLSLLIDLQTTLVNKSGQLKA